MRHVEWANFQLDVRMLLFALDQVRLNAAFQNDMAFVVRTHHCALFVASHSRAHG